jgi:AmmeMemoRadiSam system protein B
MPAPEQPRLRASVTGQPDAKDPSFIWLYDSARITRQRLRVHEQAIPILEMLDGRHTLRDVQLAVMQANGGQLFRLEILQNLVERLDEALFLESPRLRAKFAEFLRAPVREPACIGAYAGEPNGLREQLAGLFRGQKGPGLPAAGVPDGRLRGALIPHIDLYRGGHTFAWGFKELVERCDATVFVILGTSHYSSRRFTLTRKDFRTPLGIAPTDKDYVNRIATYYGNGAFEDELAHLPEHSIEFQVVFLQYCLGEKRPFRIVPIVVGSFHDCVATETAPHARDNIGRMIQALRRAEAECGEKVCYISSGDLAHIGPKFGDGNPVDAPQLEWSRRQDHALLQRMEANDLDGLCRVIFSEKDQRRICGFPPTYTLMAALRPEHGKLLHYDQYVEPKGYESVSFASLAFYQSNGG